MSTYNYAHTDFLNDTFNEDSLELSVAAESEITTELSGICLLYTSDAADE